MTNNMSNKWRPVLPAEPKDGDRIEWWKVDSHRGVIKGLAVYRVIHDWDDVQDSPSGGSLLHTEYRSHWQRWNGVQCYFYSHRDMVMYTSPDDTCGLWQNCYATRAEAEAGQRAAETEWLNHYKEEVARHEKRLQELPSRESPAPAAAASPVPAPTPAPPEVPDGTRSSYMLLPAEQVKESKRRAREEEAIRRRRPTGRTLSMVAAAATLVLIGSLVLHKCQRKMSAPLLTPPPTGSAKP